MKEKKKSNEIDVEQELILDPLSDRYRVCRNPQCREPFMTTNRGRDYCTDKCADTHYNFMRKYIKLNYNGAGKISSEEQNKPLSATVQSLPNCKPDQEWQSTFEKNMKILDELEMDLKKGTKYNIDYLVNLGFNFFVHSSRVVIHKIEAKYNSHYLILSDFRIYFTERNTVLIFCKTLKKNTYVLS